MFLSVFHFLFLHFQSGNTLCSCFCLFSTLFVSFILHISVHEAPGEVFSMARHQIGHCTLCSAQFILSTPSDVMACILHIAMACYRIVWCWNSKRAQRCSPIYNFSIVTLLPLPLQNFGLPSTNCRFSFSVCCFRVVLHYYYIRYGASRSHLFRGWAITVELFR